MTKCTRCGGNEWREPGVDMYFVPCDCAKFKRGDRVRKTKGSAWQGKVVGFYSTELTPIGYAVESEFHPGSVQIYPEAALERVDEEGT